MKTNYQWLKILSVSLGAAALVGCTELSKTSQQNGQITVKPFGQTQGRHRGEPLHAAQ